VKKRLADGRIADYWYAWKSGPRLRGEPGTPEFIASYNEAVARKVTPPTGMLLSILQGYQASAEFLDLADRTRADYIAKIKLIERKFGDFPLSAMRDRRTRGIFKAWRDELARTSRRQADYAWVVLALVIAWALDRGLVDGNPCEKGGRLYRGTRVENIWTDEDEAAFLRTAPPSAARVHAGPLDQPAAGRPSAASLERLRRRAHQAEAVEVRQARQHQGRRAAEGGAGRDDQG
jgi:hypothetical protein